MKKNMHIHIPEENRQLQFREPIWSDSKNEPILSDKCSIMLHNIKKKLDIKPYISEWDKFKKFSNNYELIHISSNYRRKNENIAFYIPLSRSFFKMWEFIKDFKLLNINSPIRTAHLAEGPGGFIEAVCRYRKLLGHYKDQIFGITLRSLEKEIPGWGKSDYFLLSHPQIRVHYGKDGTGNLYNIQNIKEFCSAVGHNKCELVTGDGGFDFSIDFNQQEVLSFRLLISQIYCSLLLVKKGGTMICKFFDTYHLLTIELIWILSICFNTLDIVKPHTSRLANSERDFVCQDFLQAPDEILKYFEHLLDNWKPNKYLYSILETPPHPQFISIIKYYNSWHAHNQSHAIEITLNLIDTERSEKTYYHKKKQSRKLCSTTIPQNYKCIIYNQTVKAIKWCIKYDIVINVDCEYLKLLHPERDKILLQHITKNKNIKKKFYT
jgi:hypothetical protein